VDGHLIRVIGCIYQLGSNLCPFTIELLQVDQSSFSAEVEKPRLSSNAAHALNEPALEIPQFHSLSLPRGHIEVLQQSRIGRHARKSILLGRAADSMLA